MEGIAKRGGRERKQRPEGERTAAAVELGEILQILRVSRGMSQAEVAEKSGVTNSALSEYERGKKSPELKNVRRLVAALGYPLSAIERTEGFLEELRQESLWPVGEGEGDREGLVATSGTEGVEVGGVTLRARARRVAALVGQAAAGFSLLLFELLARGLFAPPAGAGKRSEPGAGDA